MDEKIVKLLEQLKDDKDALQDIYWYIESKLVKR